MKNAKKLISLALTLAMVMALFSVVPIMSASAAAGDTWTLTNPLSSWGYYDGKISYNAEQNMYTVNSAANAGDNFTNTDFTLKNNGSTVNALTPNTTYRIMFDVSSQGKTIDLYTFRIGFYAYYNSNHQFKNPSGDGSRIDNLTPYAEQCEWANGDSTKYNKYHVAIDYTTPDTLFGASNGVNTYFDLSVVFTSQQNKPIYITNVHTLEYGSYDVVDEDTGESIGRLYGLEDDDVYQLLNAQGFTRAGYELYSDTDIIENDTTTITVQYVFSLQDVQDIKFDDTYAGGSPDFHYIPDAPEGHVSKDNESIKHDTSTAKGDIGQHSVTLANSYSTSGLIAGGTYRLTFSLKTFPRYTPLESLAAEIRFGQHIWDTNMITASTVYLTGEDLAAAVTGFTPASSGSVTFKISLNVTLPQTGWTSETARNIILAIYGGEYWLDNVKISTTKDFAVVDGSGNPLGTAYGRVGDSTASLIDSSLVGEDYTFTTSPATISSLIDTITLTKTLKTNIVQKINFGSDDYLGNAGNSGYYETGADRKLAKNGSVIEGTSVNSGNTFGNRAITLANDRSSSGLVAGNTYRAVVKFRSWYDLPDFKLDVTFGSGIWSVMETGKTTGVSISDKATILSAKGTYSALYLLNIDFTVPEQSAWDAASLTAKDVVISLYGTTARPVNYQLVSAYIYKPTTVTVTNYDGSYTATLNGYKGESFGDVVSNDGAAKFVNVSGQFTLENKSMLSGKVIFRGDADASFETDADDITMLINYLLEKPEAEGADLFGLNMLYGSGNENIDVRDLVALKKALANSDSIATGLPAGLHYNNYKKVWNYEFNSNTVSNTYFDRQWGQNRNLSDVDPVEGGEAKFSYAKDGMFVFAPDDNYGAGNTIVSDALTTKTTMNFTYGYLEINAKLPFSTANAPAFWLKSSPANESDPMFEIDLLETFGSTSSVSTNIHCWVSGEDYSANATEGRSATVLNTDAFHKYGFEWYKENGVSKIAFYVDGNLVKTMSKTDTGYDADFDQAMYLILENTPITEKYYENISEWALSATAATHSDYPMDVCIDYVRLYQSTSNTGNTLTR